MKTINLKIAIALLFSIVVAFSSCKKDDPTLEVDQEEYDSVKVVFTNLSDASDSLTINLDKHGNSEKSHYQLLPHQTYKIEITLFSNGKDINQEFIEEIDEHKFFFLAPKEAVTNYLYQDNDLGLQGEITFGSYDSSFDLIALLLHGLDKKHPSAIEWNSPDYHRAGGAEDLRLKISLHLTENMDRE